MSCTGVCFLLLLDCGQRAQGPGPSIQSHPHDHAPQDHGLPGSQDPPCCDSSEPELGVEDGKRGHWSQDVWAGVSGRTEQNTCSPSWSGQGQRRRRACAHITPVGSVTPRATGLPTSCAPEPSTSLPRHVRKPSCVLRCVEVHPALTDADSHWLQPRAGRAVRYHIWADPTHRPVP